MTRISHLGAASLLVVLLSGCSTDDAPEQGAAATVAEFA
jgi:PBP1b-binding outer membrane lipoprotein LpoB